MMNRSLRNFLLIVLSIIGFDLFLAPQLPLNKLYQQFIYPYSKNPMLEPVVAVVSFMFASTLFTLVKYFKKTNSSSSSSSSSDNNNNNTFIRGKISTWAFWASANVAVYLGVIYIFQQVTDYGETFYRFDDRYQPYSTEEEKSVSQGSSSSPSPSFTTLRIFIEVIASVFLYDFIFAPIHQSWHSKNSPSWWRSIHLEHHDNYKNTKAPLSVMNTFHHHILDASLQVAVNAFLQQVVGLSLVWFSSSSDEMQHRHTMSKIFHNILVTYLLVESHSGIDVWFQTSKFFPEVLGSAMQHQKHHQNGKGPYHQFFVGLPYPFGDQ